MNGDTAYSLASSPSNSVVAAISFRFCCRALNVALVFIIRLDGTLVETSTLSLLAESLGGTLITWSDLELSP